MKRIEREKVKKYNFKIGLFENWFMFFIHFSKLSNHKTKKKSALKLTLDIFESFLSLEEVTFVNYRVLL